MLECPTRFNLREESLFWLEILRDHSEFMYLAFPPSEKADAKEAKHYTGVFSDLRKQAADRFSDKLLQEIRNQAQAFHSYQQCVLSRQLVCQIGFNLPPLALEETMAEAQEFLLILDQIIPEKNAALQDMHEHLLWLWNSTAHADVILAQLDPTEAILVTKVREFREVFAALFFKAYSYLKMIRPQPEPRPSLSYLNRQAAATAKDFIKYLAVLKEDVEKCKVLGILPALLLDHYMRETHYYLEKIAVCHDPAPSAG